MRHVLFFWAVASGCGDKDSSESLDRDGDGVALSADCDDDDALVHPGADERCNGIDDDCDGPVDEDAVDAIAVFTDADADGFGDAEAGAACTPGGDQSAVGGDCDDQNSARHPDALEICNGGIDDDCDGKADDADDPARTTAYYSDLDGDGFGGGAPIQSCEPVPDRLEDGTDCDDGNPSVHPGAPEICDDVDDDCDAATTEAGVVSVEGVAYWEIQQAVDAAPDGAVVAICEGTWYENIVIDKDIVLEGRAPELSIVDGNEWGSVISVGTDGIDLTLRRLTLQHGTGEFVYGYDTHDSGLAGGGVEASRAGALSIEECVIADNTAEMGGGMLGPFEGDTLVEDSVIRGNDAVETGGGAAFWHADNWTTDIRGSEITDNTAGCDGGGVTFEGYYHNPPTVTLSDTLIDGNAGATTSSSYCEGGGIYSASHLTLTAVTISNNVADTGAGAYVGWGGMAVADDKTVVSGNSTYDGGNGGGVTVDSASWRYGTFEDNTASYGGGVALLSGSELRDATVQANRATVFGGGVYMPGDSATVRDSTISSNTSDGNGGGIGVEYRYSGTPSGSVFLGNVVITSNTAKVAGGGARVELDLESEHCDWGAAATDNSPDDVSLYSEEGGEVTYDLFGALEDFVCSVSDLVCE